MNNNISYRDIFNPKIKINESPDVTIINGVSYKWFEDGYTIGLIEDFKNKKRIIITRGYGSEFYLNIDGKDLTSFMKSKYSELNYNIPWRHEDIVQVLSNIKPDGKQSFIKFNSESDKFSRNIFDLAGRAWEVDGKVYFSFWNSLRAVKNRLEYLDKIMDILKCKKDNSFFEFIDHNDSYVSYNEAFTQIKHSSKNIENDFMRNSHSLPPSLKKFAYKGLGKKSHAGIDENLKTTAQNLALAGALTFGGVNHAPAKEIGSQAIKSVARGLRNNNPGNIIKSNIKWNGKIGNDGKFEIFNSPEQGIRALAKILLTYQERYNLNTIQELIHRWSPPSENNTGAYVQFVSKKTGIPENKKIDIKNKNVALQLMKAIIEKENGENPYTDAEIMNSIKKL